MRRPTSRGARSRTIVSTSGSSGTLRSPATPMSRRNILPSNAIRSHAAAAGRGGLRRRWGPSAVTLSTRPPATRSVAVGVARRPGVEQQHAGARGPGERDRGALLGRVGVAAGGEHRGHRRAARAAAPSRVGPPAHRAAIAARCAVEPRGSTGRTTCVSGSPKRQLNSSTHGVPSGADHQPGVEHAAGSGVPRRRISASVGSNTSRRTRSSSAGVARLTGQ